MTRKRLTSFAAALTGGILLGVIALALVPRVVGLSTFTVLSGSMRPTLGVGDVVIDEHVAPRAVRPGDVVSFEDSSRGGALVTHRVRSAQRVGDRIAFVTRGDANNVDERWSVRADGRIGRVRWHVPKVGYVLHALGSSTGRMLLITLPAILLILLELRGAIGTIFSREERTSGDRTSVRPPTLVPDQCVRTRSSSPVPVSTTSRTSASRSRATRWWS